MSTQRQNPNDGVIRRTPPPQSPGQLQLSPDLREKRMRQLEEDHQPQKSPILPNKYNRQGRLGEDEAEKAVSGYGGLVVTSIFILSCAAIIAFVYMHRSAVSDIILYIVLSIMVIGSISGTWMSQKRFMDAIKSNKRNMLRLTEELKANIRHTNYHDKQLKHLIESTNVCPWNADLAKNCFTYIGPQIVSVTGISIEDWGTKGFLLEHVVPEDRKTWLHALRNLRSGGFVTLEYRTRSKDGKLIWLRNSFCLTGSGQQSKRLVQGFITDITEQKSVEVALQTARYAAEKASQTKSNFLASMSHELRTPLNSIIGFAEIMRSEAFGSIGQPQYKEYSDNIHSSGKHLLDLINDILDFSKIEAGKFDVIKEPVDLRDIFRSCEILLRERAQRSELSLLMLAPETELMIEGDPKRLKQVFINLLSNSIKFTKPGGSVTLKYEVTADRHLIMHIIDTGIGIKPEDLSTVFEKFHQVDAEKNRDQEGTGLGLSISKSLAEMHDGVFNIQSVYGHGTTITVTFPPAMIIDKKYKNNAASRFNNLPDDDDDDFINRLQSM